MHHLQNEKWLSFRTVPNHCWHHRLSQVYDWIVLLCCYSTGSLYCTKYCVFTTIWKKKDHLESFYGFKSKRLFRINLVHGNTDNITCTILTWPGMTSSHTPHGSVNDITQDHSLNSFLVFTFDTKNVPLETSMESFKGEPMLWKFALYLN